MNKFDKPYRIAPSFDSKKNIEMFDLASRLDTHEMLQHSLINQISFDISDEEANTLIHIVINVDSRKASQHSKLSVIKFLVNNGANPDKPNKYNQTPLHLACHYQYDLIVEYLLSIDVDANFKDNMGLTPFHYLLTGDIKTIENTGEIMNFIPAPKKQDVKKNTELISIKKDIYNVLIKQLIIDKFPILTTFKNTIGNILDTDSDFLNYRIELEQKIVKLALDTSAPNYLVEIKNTVDITLKAISKKIEKLFNNFPELSEFQIHATEKTSWSHPTNIQPLSLIKNGDIKKSIKDEINKAGDNVLNLENNFVPYNDILPTYNDDGLNEIAGLHFSVLKNSFKKLPGTETQYYDNYFEGTDMNKIDSVNNMVKHMDAFDNASSIIDFSNLKYVGGPRCIELKFPGSVPNPIISQVQKISLMNSDKKLLYMLCSPLTETSIDTILAASPAIDFYDTNLVNYRKMYTKYLYGDLNNITNWDNKIRVPTAPPGILNPDPEIRFAGLCYIIFAKTAISSPDRFEELSNIPFFKGPNGEPFRNNYLVTKWFYKFMNGFNVAGFIYGMWCDLTCYFSASNLDGIVPLNLAILVSGLANNKINLDQSIYNSYKPLIIEEICDFPALSEEEKIASITMLLLNEKCNNIYFFNINQNYAGLAGISATNLETQVLLIGKLVLDYFTNPKTFSPTPSSPDGLLYKSYNKPGKKPINVLVNIILDFYDKMINKPLKQTIIDFVYLLLDYNQKVLSTPSVKDISIFKNLSTKKITSAPPTTNNLLDKNLVPSHYGLENVVTDKPKFSLPNNLVLYHFQIAHIFGLYFEGMCNPHQNFSLDSSFSCETQVKGKITYVDFYMALEPGPPTAPSPNVEHDFPYAAPDVDVLHQHQLPLPFDNVIATNFPDEAKFRYYNIINRSIVNPSVHSYFALVVKRIQYYQKKIGERLKDVRQYIGELVKGKTTNLGSLITLIYPQIVSYCKIISSYIESYERINKEYENESFWKNSQLRSKFKAPETYPYSELAKSINKINANFYLYYYVFSPDKLVKLSKFNYYQIPTTSPNKYLIYSSGSDENVYDSADKGSGLASTLPDFKTHTDNLSSGFVAQFSIGNYVSFYNEYKSNNFNTVMGSNSAAFVFTKSDKLPPSLFDNLEQFYKFCLIQVVINIINEIDTNKITTSKTIYDNLQKFIKATGIEVDSYDISAYHIVSKIVQEIVREQFNIFIYEEVHKVFDRVVKDITKVSGINIPPDSINTKTPVTISLDKTDVKFKDVTKVNQVKNLYNLLVHPGKSDIFILYSNDFTNLARLKLKSGININTKIINLLLGNRGSPYHINLEGQTPIYNLIKNYNFGPVKTLKTLGVDFRYFEDEQPMKFLLKELNNNIDKIIGSLPSKPSNKNILSNFDNYLYNDVKTLITSNEVYGNNILAYLPLSFNMSSYIVLQYLFESLINTDNEFTLDDLINFLSLVEVDISNINKNYLEENLDYFKIPNDFNIFIAREFIKEKVSIKRQLEIEKKAIDKNITKLQLSSPELGKKMAKSSKYIQLDADIKKLDTDIKSLGKLISGPKAKLTSTSTTTEYKIITRYNNITKPGIHNGLVMNGWEQLLDLEYTKDNYNLALIQLLIKQKALIQNFNLANLETLRALQKPLKKLSDIAESYFSAPKFTDTNKVAHFIRDMIEYLTETTICTGLELVMRRILHTYFSNTLSDDSQQKISDRIDFILESKSYGMSESLLDILKNKIAPELAKNASEIFDNQSDEQGHLVRPVRDVLIGFFQNLENSPIKIPPEIITVFIKDVVSYFDTFASKAILLWHVNAENIFKYFINNYRCVETITSL